jgi:hypothetical protein
MSKKVIRLTESELKNYIQKIISEQKSNTNDQYGMGAIVTPEWDRIIQYFSTQKQKPKVIKTKTFTSLNWGSHSGPGFDWGLSIDTRGEFIFQSSNINKSKSVLQFAKSHNLSVYESGGNNGLNSEKLNNLRTDKIITLVGQIITYCNQSESQINQKNIGHMGMRYLMEQLSPFGFKIDMKKYFGVPTIYKGFDDDGVFIQFYQDNGFYFQLGVNRNGKEILLKKYPLKESENYTSDNAVKQIMKDVDKFKNMQIVLRNKG